MNETPAELAWLDELIETSHAGAGTHLQSVFQPPTRIGAAELTALLTGMQVLDVATVSRAGRPIISAVDGFFHRGRWHFGTAAGSVKVRHLRARPWISAAHNRSDDLSVVVHGRAEPIDPAAPSHQGLAAMMGTFYGADWKPMVGALYFRIEPDRMFTFRNTYK